MFKESIVLNYVFIHNLYILRRIKNAYQGKKKNL